MPRSSRADVEQLASIVYDNGNLQGFLKPAVGLYRWESAETVKWAIGALNWSIGALKWAIRALKWALVALTLTLRTLKLVHKAFVSFVQQSLIKEHLSIVV